MSKQKIVIRLGVPNAKNWSKAMQQASKFAGVNSVAITGNAKDRLEVVGEGINITCLVNHLRKKVCQADIVVVEDEEEEKKKREEEAKKKKAEEEKKKKAEQERKKEEEKLWAACPPAYPGYNYCCPVPFAVCEDQPAGCHVM